MRALGFFARLLVVVLALSQMVSHPALAENRPSVNRDASASYVLGAGDRLQIIVFGEPQLSGEHTVSASGIVSFPLIGDIPAASQTPAQVQEAIRSRLAGGYLKDPRVAVEVLAYRPFYILGEVNRPGEYPYRANLKLEQAIATAGGYSYRANRSRFVIVREDGSERKMRFKEAAQMEIQPGDTIRILERFF